MSKGMGRIESDALAVVNANGRLDALTVAALVFTDDPASPLIDVTHSQLASVRRALGSLRRKGHVFRIGRHYPFGHGVTAPRVIYASRGAAQVYADKLKGTFGESALSAAPDILTMAGLVTHSDA